MRRDHPLPHLFLGTGAVTLAGNDAAAGQDRAYRNQNSLPQGEEWDYELGFCLDQFLASNFEKVFGGKLKLYVDEQGQEGWRYPTPIGEIDMLAVEQETGSFVVIKVKHEWATEEDLGRLLAEMKWVGENLGGGKSDVKGLIICRHKQRLLDFAAKTYGVTVKRYRFGFKLLD